MKKLLLFISSCVLFTVQLFSQTVIRQDFLWEDTPTTYLIGEQTVEQWAFPDAKFGDAAPSHPYWIYRFPVSGPGVINVAVSSLSFEPLSKRYAPEDEQLGTELKFTTNIVREPEGYFAKISVVPFIKDGNTYQKASAFVLNVNFEPRSTLRGGPPFNSVLSDGDVYKIAIPTTGVYKLSYGFLKDELGISNLDNIDPRSIKVYGNGGGLVPYDVNEDRPEDLVENAVRIVGEGDGSFDGGDYLLLYAEGPNKWNYDVAQDRFDQQTNIYDSRNYYFIKIGGNGNGQRIQEQASLEATDGTSTTYDGLFRLEEDRVNPLHEIEATGTGTGQHWYGDFFKFAREKTYDDLFELKGLQTNEPVTIRASMALRARPSSRFFLDIAGQTLSSQTVPGVPIGEQNEIYNDLAPNSSLNGTVNLTEENLDVLLRYPHPGGSDQSSGWLDFIQARARLALRVEEDQTFFRDTRSMEQITTTFVVDNASNDVSIWDISNPLQPQEQATTISGNSLRFGLTTAEQLREFVAFRNSSDFPGPEAVGKIEPQNLHGLASQEMLIVYHPDFAEKALELTEHRRSFSGLEVTAVSVDQIYNEFSSGRVSPTAIRDFAKLIFERDGSLRYLLLIGDGSFDCRDLYGFGGNFVPVYERDENHELKGFPSDDFFVIFDNEPGADPLANDMSIAVGRLPVKTPAEAATVVNKIIQYDTNPDYYQDWRTRLTFVGDDEDNAAHSDDSNEAAELVRTLKPQFNINKLLFDLFPQESTPAGDRYSIVEEQLNRAISRGTFITTYLGHGGPRGWAQERVLDIPMTQNWENLDRLCIFLTATCTFGDYDNGAFVSAGEELILSPRGGAIALLTTTRPVFANRNAALTNRSLTEMLKQDEQGDWTSLGDVIRIAKNALSAPGSFENERKFMLMGDPAMRPALPRFRVATTLINGIEVDTASLDTLSALETVTITGQVEDLNGSLLSNFNGTVFPTIYDKRIGAQTLRNDPEGSPERTYMVRKNVLFRGRATVTNGQFTFSFVVPKDINYQYGAGKISYYAADPDQRVDAGGSEERFIIGGSNPDGVVDDTPPIVEVFMNSEDFVAGSQVTANPTLVVKLSDDFGINVTGNSIGHDLEGFLNENTQSSYLLNDFYEAENDDYTKGEVRFPLKDLAPGTYTMRVRAWDVANNLGEGTTEFIVADDGKIALQNVLNYPNPFTDRTCFQFDTNVAGEDMEVLIQVFTVSGRLVKTIEELIPSNDGALRLDDCIEWDGKDDYGDQLARGVYLYQVRVRTQGGQELSGQSEFEKLVILK
ncbi:type IX secretion system sortase PorU [Lewinella cohaerens]|uniref:type IX secretion system sortase PorU n=1 Tax=Lewinella cohaerens TaxID=70995 RepID=UPI000377C898|nr:type IX secretion system sortase PorU [Lewinella cohaerens]